MKEPQSSRVALKIILLAAVLGLSAWLFIVIRSKQYQPMRLINWEEQKRNHQRQGEELLRMMENDAYNVGKLAGVKSRENREQAPTEEELKGRTAELYAPNGIINPVHLGAYQRGFVKGFHDGYRKP